MHVLDMPCSGTGRLTSVRRHYPVYVRPVEAKPPLSRTPYKAYSPRVTCHLKTDPGQIPSGQEAGPQQRCSPQDHAGRWTHWDCEHSPVDPLVR